MYIWFLFIIVISSHFTCDESERVREEKRERSIEKQKNKINLPELLTAVNMQAK